MPSASARNSIRPAPARPRARPGPMRSRASTTRPLPNSRVISSSPKRARKRCRGRSRNRRRSRARKAVQQPPPRRPRPRPPHPPPPRRPGLAPPPQRQALLRKPPARHRTTRRSARWDRPSSRRASRWKSVFALSVKRLSRSAGAARDQRVIGLCLWPSFIAKLVGDGVAAVASEITAGHLAPRRSLPPLVFGDVEQAIDPRHHFPIKTSGDDGCERLLALDQPL